MIGPLLIAGGTTTGNQIEMIAQPPLSFEFIRDYRAAIWNRSDKHSQLLSAAASVSAVWVDSSTVAKRS
jgi:hypothetical protein